MASPQSKKASTETATLLEAPVTLDHEQIALVAYAIWQAKGCPDGSSEADWIQAERELMVPVVQGR